MRIILYVIAPLVKNGGIGALNDNVSSSTRNIEDADSAIFARDLFLTDQRFRLERHSHFRID